MRKPIDMSLEDAKKEIEECGCDPYEFGPPHFPSSLCDSGKRNHCSCDTCF